jgi:hypothetical protein
MDKLNLRIGDWWILPLFALVLVACAAIGATGETLAANDAGPVLELKISTDRTRFAAGDSIPIHAEITNVSSHDLLIGRNLWMNDSPSHITLFVTPTGGSNTMPGESGAVDGLGPGQNLAKSMLDWFLLLALETAMAPAQGFQGI